MKESLEALDAMEEEKPRSYRRFEEYGEDFIRVIDDGISNVSGRWTSANEILGASDAEKRSINRVEGKFASIYNLLCDVDLLSAFNDSPAYNIDMFQYEKETLVEAWEYVSGEEFEELEEYEEPDVNPPPLETEDMYQELMD